MDQSVCRYEPGIAEYVNENLVVGNEIIVKYFYQLNKDCTEALWLNCNYLDSRRVNFGTGTYLSMYVRITSFLP